MKTTAIAVFAAAALFAGCAHAPRTTAAAQSAPCQSAPQWILNDPAGKPVDAVYICFGSKGELLYATKPLTPAQVAALTPPAAAPRNRPDAKDMADIAARKAKLLPKKAAK